MKSLCAIFLLVYGASANADPIYWAPFFPSASSTTQTYRHADGAVYANYIYLRYNQETNSGFPYLYNTYLTPNTSVASLGRNVGNIGRNGFLGIWTKLYAGQLKPITYDHLWFGADNTVTEVGDYLNDGTGSFNVFGYANVYGNYRSGLNWSPQNSGTAVTSVVLPYYPQLTQPSPSQSAFSYVWAEKLASFTPLYGAKNGVWGKGNGKTYQNVVHILFYHGPSSPNNVDCSSVPGNQYKGMYAHVAGYNTYLSEYYLAAGKWIVQERTVYIEDASFWRQRGTQLRDCSGAAFNLNNDNSFGATYIDDRT